VDAGRSIDDAFSDMARFGVHALLVTKEMRECDHLQVLGLITAYDIERERPHRSPGTFVARVPTKINVLDVMTPWDELPLVHYASLDTLTARDIYEMFKGTGLTHLLVIDINSDDSGVARGLLSRTTLSKRLRRQHNDFAPHRT
jgi:CBS domain-containing protein